MTLGITGCFRRSRDAYGDSEMILGDCKMILGVARCFSGARDAVGIMRCFSAAKYFSCS